METIKCAICGSEKSSPLLQTEDYRLHTISRKFTLVRCQQCGVVYLNPRPKEEEFSKFYPNAFYAKQSLMSKFASKILNYTKFNEVADFQKNGRIIDVGCGDGDLLFAFKERGWETYGVDTSENACRLSTQTLKRNIYNCALKNCSFSDGYFDVVILNHVVEHMSNPNEELVEVNRILKGDGVVFIYTPNIGSYQLVVTGGKWLHLDVPRHILLYSPNTISILLRNIGFKIVKVRYPLSNFPFDLYQSFKLRFASKHSLLFAVVSPLLGIASLQAKLLPAWRGSMLVVAVKKSSRKYYLRS